MGERIAETDVASREIKDAIVALWMKYRETHPNAPGLGFKPIVAPGAYCPIFGEPEGEYCVFTDGDHNLLLEWRFLAEEGLRGGT